MSRAAASTFAWAEAAAGATVVVGLAVVVVLASVVLAAVVALAAVVVVEPALCADADTVGRPSASAARADMPNARRVVALRFLPRCPCPCLTVVMPNLLLVPTAPRTRGRRAPGIRTQPETRWQERFGRDVAGRQEQVARRSVW